MMKFFLILTETKMLAFKKKNTETGDLAQFM